MRIVLGISGARAALALAALLMGCVLPGGPAVGALLTFGAEGGYPSLIRALQAAAQHDTLQQAGPSSDTLATSYTCALDLTVLGQSGSTIAVLGKRLRLTGSLSLRQADLTAALFVSAPTGTFHAAQCRFVHPGPGTDDALSGFGLGFQVASIEMEQCLLDSCRAVGGDSGKILFFRESAGPTRQVFRECDFHASNGLQWHNFSAGAVLFTGCRFSGGAPAGPWAAFTAQADLDTVQVRDCVFDAPVSAKTGWTLQDVKTILIEDCTLLRWGLSDLDFGGIPGNGPLFHIAQAATRPRPKVVRVTGNLVSRTQDRAPGSTGLFFLFDRDTSTTLLVSGNEVRAEHNGEFDSFFRASAMIRRGQVLDNHIMAGTISICPLAVEDTLAAALGTGWRIAGNVIDHGAWAATSPLSTLLTCCVSHSNVEGNVFRSGACSHLVLLNDDTIAGGTWRAASGGWGASHNLFQGNTYEQLAAPGTAYGIVDKGRGNLFFDERMIQHGSTASTSRAWLLAGDSARVSQCAIWSDKPGPGLHGIMDDGAWSGTQAKGNLFAFCSVAGDADLALMSSSGDGSGLRETDNHWVPAFRLGFDADGRAVDPTSDTDSSAVLLTAPLLETFAGATLPPPGWLRRSGPAAPDAGWRPSTLLDGWQFGTDPADSAGLDPATLALPSTPGPHWLLLAPLEAAPGASWSFRLGWRNESGATASLRLAQLRPEGWADLGRWEMPAGSAARDSLVVLAAPPSTGILRAALVYEGGEGLCAAVDDLRYGAPGDPLAAPFLRIHLDEGGTCRLEWTPVPGAAAYRIESADPAMPLYWRTLLEVEAGTTSLVLPVSEGCHAYRVLALS